MRKIIFAMAFAASGVFAGQVNDLAPDFDNTIQDNGFWDTSEHPNVEVAECASDINKFNSLDSVICRLGFGSIAIFDSREKTLEESNALSQFSSWPVGMVIIVR